VFQQSDTDCSLKAELLGRAEQFQYKLLEKPESFKVTRINNYPFWEYGIMPKTQQQQPILSQSMI